MRANQQLIVFFDPNRCSESQVIDLMSAHYKDGRKLPGTPPAPHPTLQVNDLALALICLFACLLVLRAAELLQKMVAAKDASAGMFNTRQIVFGLFDQTLHTLMSDADLKALDSAKYFGDTWNELMGLQVTAGTNFAASFGHLAGGYDAQYYGYMVCFHFMWKG